MIDFRYHLVSVVAIFFALATGVALGAGPLQDPLTEGLADQTQQDRLDTEQLRADLAAVEDREAFSDAYAAATASDVVAGVLRGRTVAIMTLPGADDSDVRAVRASVLQGGATVAATVHLSPLLLDPAQRQLAEGLATRLLARVGGSTAPQRAGSYELVGATVARAFLTRSADPVVQDNDANSIEAALVGADFVRVDGTVERRAQLALVVAGDPPVDAAEGQPVVAAGIVAALDAGSLGAVVAGRPASAAAGAVLAVLDSDAADRVSTVDVVDLPAGQVVSALALAEQARGGSGHYGAGSAADGAVPDLRPAGTGR